MCEDIATFIVFVGWCADGSLSDTAVNLTPGSLERPRGHRTGGPQTRLMAQNMSGLGKKSSSTSQLSAVSATGMIRAFTEFRLVQFTTLFLT